LELQCKKLPFNRQLARFDCALFHAGPKRLRLSVWPGISRAVWLTRLTLQRRLPRILIHKL
jgi:hypothetical protein